MRGFALAGGLVWLNSALLPTQKTNLGNGKASNAVKVGSRDLQRLSKGSRAAVEKRQMRDTKHAGPVDGQPSDS